MHIFEITGDLKHFSATVRVMQGNSSMTVKTVVVADGLAQARAMLSHVYGAKNVLSVTSSANTLQLQELQANTSPTPEQTRIKSLQMNVEKSREQLQTERDRQRKQREDERKRKIQSGIGASNSTTNAAT